ncbi:unnamed protein product [Sphagnum balticum]
MTSLKQKLSNVGTKRTNVDISDFEHETFSSPADGSRFSYYPGDPETSNLHQVLRQLGFGAFRSQEVKHNKKGKPGKEWMIPSGRHGEHLRDYFIEPLEQIHELAHDSFEVYGHLKNVTGARVQNPAIEVYHVSFGKKEGYRSFVVIADSQIHGVDETVFNNKASYVEINARGDNGKFYFGPNAYFDTYARLLEVYNHFVKLAPFSAFHTSDNEFGYFVELTDTKGNYLVQGSIEFMTDPKAMNAVTALGGKVDIHGIDILTKDAADAIFNLLVAYARDPQAIASSTGVPTEGKVPQ